ncbi:hypothetical protein JL49_04240 [Pseudoalteromonas luteoviolacea]|nr:hypothetical protein JL49_04240 [Pseudoalteromonas luteoviolacea]
MEKLKNIIIIMVLCTFSKISLATVLNIEHVANSGVKISSGEKSILIDALFEPHKRFNSLNEEENTQLTLQGADVVVATHVHSDHFGNNRVANFLNKNPKTLFFGTPQTLTRLEGKVTPSQLRTESLTAFESKLFKHDGVHIEVLNFPHMGSHVHAKTQNYAYLIELNGWKVLHIGDGDINENRIDGLKLAHKNIDVALVHDRCLVQQDCAQRMKQMNVGQVVFVHMTDNRVKPVSAWIKENLPSANILVTGHEKVSIRR